MKTRFPILKISAHKFIKGYADFVIDHHTLLKELLDNDLLTVLNEQFYQAMSVYRVD